MPIHIDYNLAICRTCPVYGVYIFIDTLTFLGKNKFIEQWPDNLFREKQYEYRKKHLHSGYRNR